MVIIIEIYICVCVVLKKTLKNVHFVASVGPFLPFTGLMKQHSDCTAVHCTFLQVTFAKCP